MAVCRAPSRAASCPRYTLRTSRSTCQGSSPRARRHVASWASVPYILSKPKPGRGTRHDNGHASTHRRQPKTASSRAAVLGRHIPFVQIQGLAKRQDSPWLWESFNRRGCEIPVVARCVKCRNPTPLGRRPG
eukprot:2349508-Prymnesium_polylepis.1